MPRRIRVGEPQLLCHLPPHSKPLISQRSKCASRPSELQNQRFGKGGFHPRLAPSQRAKPARRLQAKRNRQCGLHKRPADHDRVLVLIREAAERSLEPQPIGGEDRLRPFKKQDQGRIGYVLAGRAPVNEAGGFWIFFGNKSGELFNQGNQKIGGICGGGGEGAGLGGGAAQAVDSNRLIGLAVDVVRGRSSAISIGSVELAVASCIGAR